MKKVLILLFFISVINIHAQDDTYVNFTAEQTEETQKISSKKLTSNVTIESGMLYDGILFWHVILPDGKEYYFNSTKDYTDIKHEQSSYSSLMEYVIETIGF